MNVVIRADGSHDMGYGHLFRTDTIATAMLEHDDSVMYLTRTPEEVQSVCNDMVDIVPLHREETDCLLSQLDEIGPDITLLDLPEAPFELQRRIHSISPLAVILGSARHQLCCDGLINGHLFAEDEDYTWFGEEPTWFLGPSYLPLRRPFPEIAAHQSNCPEKPETGIIIMGGSDPHNLTPKVMRAFDSLDLTVTVVIGPGSENEESIERAARSSTTDFKIKHDPPDLPILMTEADIAVSGFGTTIYELMATGTPFVGIARTNLERETAEKVQPYLDIPFFTKHLNSNRLRQTLECLVTEKTKRAELQNQFSQLVDGKGAHRIAEKIPELVTHRSV